VVVIGCLSILILATQSKTIKFKQLSEHQTTAHKAYYLDDKGDLKFGDKQKETELNDDQKIQQLQAWNKSNLRKIVFKKLAEAKATEINGMAQLSDEQKKEIEEAVQNNFIGLLKQVYAITSRNRMGRK
jgi:hypothetical protein